MKTKSVLLFSGGLDSALLLYSFVPPDTLCLSISYGQPEQEIEAAAVMSEKMNFVHKIIQIHGLYSSDSSGMFCQNDSVAADTIVPARNAILISMAASFGAEDVWIGCNADDQDDYADCRQGFLRNIGRSLEVTVRAPLMQFTKKEIVRMSQLVGIDLSETVSCYRGTGCGVCSSCILLGEATR